MCAIAGFNWKDETKVRLMASDLSYRGPDASGVFTDAGISLGHDRLAVIDLSAEANQPMQDASGELALVFNGEIYNFKELREELAATYPFRTHSDTEVILAGYRAWGKEVVTRLNGMFAFALWDRRSQTLFCARDHAGMKPFYYFWNGTKFIFASEIRALFSHPIERKLRTDTLNHYLRLGYVPHPETLIENVYALPPSSTLTLSGSTLSVESYANAGGVEVPRSYREAAHRVRETVIASVKRHLVADVPVGIYLSGGIDSSVVLSAAARHTRNLSTFTVGFSLAGGEEEEKFNHDFELAKRTAKHFGATHRPFILSTKEALATFPEMVTHNSDPISNPTSIAMLLLARFARQEVTVALTGNGGDELFGGYDRYRMALAAQYYRALPGVVRSLGSLHPRLRKLDQEPLDLFAQFMFQKDERLSRVLVPSVFVSGEATKAVFKGRFTGAGDSVAQLIDTDRESWLPDHFFMLSDHMSMASSLEERMPLLDVELVSLARSFPRSYKTSLFGTKKILKDAFKNDLPEYLLREPKRGWFSPAAKWLRDPAFSAFARGVLSPDYYEGTRSLFAWKEVERMLERHINKEEYNLHIVWALMTFQAWARANQVHV